LDNGRDPKTGRIKKWASQIIRDLASYTEVSPSGTGVKIFLKGKVPGKLRRKGDIEMYDSGRYFTVTGRSLKKTPLTVKKKQRKLEKLYEQTFGTKDDSQNSLLLSKTSINGELTDAQIIEKLNKNKNAQRLWNGDFSGHDSQSKADLSLCGRIAFYAGPDPNRIARLFRQSGLGQRPKASRDDYVLTTVNKALEGKTEYFGDRTSSKSTPKSEQPKHVDDDCQRIIISTQEHKVNDQVLEALSAVKTIYKRSGSLVQIVRDNEQLEGIRRSENAPHIAPLPKAVLRELTSKVCSFFKEVQGVLQPTHPPSWCIAAIHARGQWKNIRPLTGFVQAPTLRGDGTIISNLGYDRQTGLVLIPDGPLPKIPKNSTLKMAKRAVERLLNVVGDFPFSGEHHKSAWLASLLTPLARYTYEGPSPLLLIDSNVRGSGKGLLADCTAIIVSGRRMSIMAQPKDDDETRKRITALSLFGDSLILIDNISSALGCAALDAALTGTVWRDRILGHTKIVEMPLLATWFATGNNVVLKADTSRRVCHIRLESNDEFPEERTGFEHPDLRSYITKN
jgi:hypothetical protein